MTDQATLLPTERAQPQIGLHQKLFRRETIFNPLMDSFHFFSHTESAKILGTFQIIHFLPLYALYFQRDCDKWWEIHRRNSLSPRVDFRLWAENYSSSCPHPSSLFVDAKGPANIFQGFWPYSVVLLRLLLCGHLTSPPLNVVFKWEYSPLPPRCRYGFSKTFVEPEGIKRVTGAHINYSNMSRLRKYKISSAQYIITNLSRA